MSIAVALYVVGLLASGYLVYRYARYSPWRSSAIGRGFMFMKTALLAVFVFVLASVIFGDYPGEDLFRLALIGYADFALIYQLTVVMREQGRARRRRDECQDVL